MIGFKAGYNAQHTYPYRSDGMGTSKSAETVASSATWTCSRFGEKWVRRTSKKACNITLEASGD